MKAPFVALLALTPILTDLLVGCGPTTPAPTPTSAWAGLPTATSTPPPVVVSVTPAPTTRAATAPPPTQTPKAVAQPETTTVTVYFPNPKLDPDAANCRRVYPVSRMVPRAPAVVRATLEQLLAGPTPDEMAQGYSSMFGEKTKTALRSVKVANRTAYVDLADIRQTIPNASTSCGAAAFLAQVETTLKQFPEIGRVIFAVEGKPRTFYEWMQIGCYEVDDNCDEAPFQSSS